MPAPPGHCPPESRAGPPTGSWVQPLQLLCLSFPSAQRAMVPSPIQPQSSSSLHLPNGPELPHSPPGYPGCPLSLTSAWGRVACRAAELPGSWKRRAETRCNESTKCHQETGDGPSSLLGHQPSSSSSSVHSSRQSQARLRSSLGETSWHGVSAAAGWPGRAVPGCAGSASSWAQPQPQSTRITLDLCRFPHQNREGGGRFNFRFPCQSSSAFRPSGKSFSAMERRLEWLVLSSSGQGWGGSDDPELGSGGGWPGTGWIHGWAAAASTAACGCFAEWGALPRQAMRLPGRV